MADKQISQLVAATTLNNEDLLVIQQGQVAKKLSGESLAMFVYLAAGSMIDEVNSAVEEAQAAVDELLEEKNAIAQTIADMARLGTDTTLTTPGMAADSKAVGDRIADVESVITGMTTATVEDEGKALLAKTVIGGKVTEWEFGEAGGGLTATQANLLLTILEEAIYGSDQETNIELLRKALMNIAPVSISAVLESIPLVGLHYSDLEFTVTATFEDESTMVVDGYTVTTPGAVVSGSNTVTLVYRGVSTDVTFTASSEQTYSISYSLTDVVSSNMDYLIIDDDRYETTLSVDDDHYISSVIVTMGGTDITSTAYTSATKTILIAEVTGNVAITAVAAEYIYMDDLLYTRNEGFSNCYGYPNNSTSGTRIIGGNYNYAPFVAAYPALHDCTVHWKVTNNTESDLALDNCGFGSIYNYENSIYGGSAAIIYAFNCVKVDNLSHKLAPGESLEGDISVTAGHSLCFICKYSDFASFDIDLVGNYEQDTFAGYTEINPTSQTAPNYGAYRNVSYYSDDGNTLIATKNDYPKRLIESIEAGTYDVYYSMRVQGSIGHSNWRNITLMLGGMSQNTDANVYYAGGDTLQCGCNLWRHTQFTISESNMSLVSWLTNLNYATTTNPKLSIMYKKVVTE